VKRVIVSLMVVVGALGSACTEEEESLPAAGLSGTYDVVLVKDPQRDGSGNPLEGDLLFVTSTDRNELRVLDLKKDGAERGYLRAPNPLEALSIPVLDRPQALARDVNYGGDGNETGGPYVYARSNGSTRISVVAADRSLLRQVRLLETSQLVPSGATPPPPPSAGPVTAFAARGPDASGLSTLYYATQESTGARLWALRLPGPEALLQGGALEGPVRLLEGVLPADVAVSSLLVLPNMQLAVATRGTAASGPGKSYKVDLQTSPATVTELNFGGQQVLQLATHPRLPEVPATESTPAVAGLAEGARIFGILDPSNCGAGQAQCSAGVLAVDSATGEVLKDVTGHPMMPLGLGNGLPMGLSLSTNTSVNATESGAVRMLGIVPLSNGNILLFDALELRLIDVDTFENPADPDAVEDAQAQVSLVTAQGTAETGDITVQVTHGVTRNETYQLTYQGVLPGMSILPRDPAASDFRVPAEPIKGKGQLVQPGDILVLFPEGVGVQLCPTDLVVTTVQPSSDPTQLTLTTNSAIPPACAGHTRFLVRAGGSQPLVLTSGSEGYLQRLGLTGSFSRTGSYFFHPPGYTGASEGVDVSFTVSNPRVTGLSRGDRYVVSTLSRFFPYSIRVDTNIQQLQFFLLPGPVVQAEVGGTDYAYIAYPSADGVLQVNLQLVFPDVANSRGVFPFQ
jgi:hypothetical protein